MKSRTVEDVFDNIDTLMGDTPVSVQLGAALSRMASKEHKHDEYVSRAEFDVLKKQVEFLLDLVGDMPVSEQINIVIKKNLEGG